MGRVRRYHVTTFGCQMNAHDSERIRGLLEDLGLGEAVSQDEADVVVFNTCTVREKPDTRLAAHLANARALKERDPERVVAVGGCYAEAQRERIFELYPFVDVAFGPGSIAHLGDWLGAGGVGVARGGFGTGEERAFAAELPARRLRPFQGWVQVSMGCNSVCSYCIVPRVRGRELSRRPGEILAEVNRLARKGVREVTLLGQNVNSWGRDLMPHIRTEFGELLRALDAVPGIERIRFTSPHPKDFRRPVIEAIGDCAAVCEHIHLPAQSGSSAVLKRMRRTYSRERYLRLVDELRAAIPDLALTTDIIVGFPGETDAAFEATMDVVRRLEYSKLHVFRYSARPGTAAASRTDEVASEVKKERSKRLIDLGNDIRRRFLAGHLGRPLEVLVEDERVVDGASICSGQTDDYVRVWFEGAGLLGTTVVVEAYEIRADGLKASLGR
jgi:tRNA-2-methylthio-N6-dimethylallyladenosine synthase